MCVSTKYYEEIACRQVRVNTDWLWIPQCSNSKNHIAIATLRIVDLALAEFDKPMSPGVTRQRGAWWLLSRSLRPTGSVCRTSDRRVHHFSSLGCLTETFSETYPNGFWQNNCWWTIMTNCLTETIRNFPWKPQGKPMAFGVGPWPRARINPFGRAWSSD